jgi:formylglycine-generating enzyme required for sulfatase activity
MNTLTLRTCAALIALTLAACSTNVPAPTATAAPTLPPTLEPSATPLPIPTHTPAPTAIPDRLALADGIVMVLIPAGEFTMGLADGLGDERPAHTVVLDSYYLALTETTNDQYRACVDAGVCQPPARPDCCTENPHWTPIWPDYFANPQYGKYPALFISWNAADTYCRWRGMRLPTEAEWEKAARGPDGGQYPWGDQKPDPSLLDFYWTAEEYPAPPSYTPSPVGSYPAGASPYGILDMAGNVYEWVHDWYADAYYAVSPAANPTGPAEGSFKVSRGGSFFNQWYRQRSVGRNNAFLPPTSFHFDGGVRCAMNLP